MNDRYFFLVNCVRIKNSYIDYWPPKTPASKFRESLIIFHWYSFPPCLTYSFSNTNEQQVIFKYTICI